MKSKNQVIWADEETLRRYKAEFDYIGRPCEIQGDKLVVFAIPPKPVKQKQERGRGRRA
jgi:hypothetical protein